MIAVQYSVDDEIRIESRSSGESSINTKHFCPLVEFAITFYNYT